MTPWRVEQSGRYYPERSGRFQRIDVYRFGQKEKSLSLRSSRGYVRLGFRKKISRDLLDYPTEQLKVSIRVKCLSTSIRREMGLHSFRNVEGLFKRPGSIMVSEDLVSQRSFARRALLKIVRKPRRMGQKMVDVDFADVVSTA